MRPNQVEREGAGVSAGTGKRRFSITVTVGLLVVLCFAVLIGVEGVHSATKDSSFCVSCHVMEPVYGTWSHSAHREVAGCNDCHTDNTNYFTKTYTKATAGIQHLYHNTFSELPDRLRIADSNTALVQGNCIRCHEDVVRNLNMDPDRRCFDCHRYTPHSNYR